MEKIPCQNARILVVDDEPANLKLLDKMLRAQGYTQIVLIQSPLQVLEKYREAPPDLILLDINMPEMDGFQVMQQLHALQDPLAPPIVILTAQHGQAYLLRALAEGARDFITKPFDRVELLMRVRNLLEAQQGKRLLHDQNKVLEDMVRVRTEELNSTRLQIIRRLGQAAEYRDNETGYHILRMSQVSALLASELGWDQAMCDLMLSASPMHDIGKIGIPDAVLLKPGKLDADEWAIMKTHTTIGGRLLDGDDSGLLRTAREIALTHHEKWDGSGYPLGLAGEDIPLTGRIVAVADVFDALTSARPYKRPWPLEEAVAYINSESGRHFDPLVVNAFNSVLPAIGEIRDRYVEQFPPPADLEMR
ncbi:MAG: response regulator [Azonexus sp.]|nr:HD domain-containing phosphohydrolase [Azonexus sp.]MCK6412369.1 response regulator [Azonexus sp.]